MISVQTVFLIDSNPILHDALCHVLPAESIAVKWFDGLEKFMINHNESFSGCLLIDNSKFNSDIISMQKSLNNAGITLPSIFLTNEADIPMVVKAIQIKATNIIIKPFKNALLLESLHLALETDRNKQQEGEIAETIYHYYLSLSKREKQVMQLIIDGASNKTMAQTLQITLKTIEAHRAKVMRKMHINSLAQLVRTAIKYNLVKEKLTTQ